MHNVRRFFFTGDQLTVDAFVPQQEKAQVRKELWRIEDVMAGLSTSKANYKVTISSITNPGETHKHAKQQQQPNQLVKVDHSLRPPT